MKVKREQRAEEWHSKGSLAHRPSSRFHTFRLRQGNVFSPNSALLPRLKFCSIFVCSKRKHSTNTSFSTLLDVLGSKTCLFFLQCEWYFLVQTLLQMFWLVAGWWLRLYIGYIAHNTGVDEGCKWLLEHCWVVAKVFELINLILRFYKRLLIGAKMVVSSNYRVFRRFQLVTRALATS